jgi:glycosyltransferase involved in cell wall biosynthesis
MKVSVIIPAYNEEKYIRKCLQSLVNQEILANEIIVVDNNCSDKTVEIAKKFGITIVLERKQGMIYARNRGFNSAKYEIIARCDADTILPKDWIKKIINNFKNKQIDALSGPIVYHDSFLRSASIHPSHLYLESLKLFSNGNRYLVGPNMIITKKIWSKVKNEVNLDDSIVHEDIDLSLNITKIGGKIGYDNTLVVKSSSRRILNKPDSFFLEYPARFVTTFLVNKINPTSFYPLTSHRLPKDH